MALSGALQHESRRRAAVKWRRPSRRGVSRPLAAKCVLKYHIEMHQKDPFAPFNHTLLPCPYFSLCILPIPRNAPGLGDVRGL